MQIYGGPWVARFQAEGKCDGNRSFHKGLFLLQEQEQGEGAATTGKTDYFIRNNNKKNKCRQSF